MSTLVSTSRLGSWLKERNRHTQFMGSVKSKCNICSTEMRGRAIICPEANISLYKSSTEVERCIWELQLGNQLQKKPYNASGGISNFWPCQSLIIPILLCCAEGWQWQHLMSRCKKFVLSKIYGVWGIGNGECHSRRNDELFELLDGIDIVQHCKFLSEYISFEKVTTVNLTNFRWKLYV